MHIRSLDSLGLKQTVKSKAQGQQPVFGAGQPDTFTSVTGAATGTVKALGGNFSVDLTGSDMKELQKRGVLVVGANGTMGKDIMQNARSSGFNVVAQEQDIALALKSTDDITLGIAKAKSNGFIKEKQFQDIMANTTAQVIDGKKVGKAGQEGGYKPGEIPNVGLVVEAVPESLPMKQSLFANLEKLLPEDTILATNTSSLSVNDIAKSVKHPERVIGLHYFWPAVSNQLIEIIPGDKTSPEVIDKTMKYARAIGKIPVLVKKDSPGFVANRLLVSVVLEGLHLFEEGYGDPKKIDYIANKILWGRAADLGFVQKTLLPPFVFMKDPKYTSLGPEIIANLSTLGKHMTAPAFIYDEQKRVQGIQKGPLKEVKSELAAAEAKLEALERQRTALEASLPLEQADAQVKALGIDTASAEVDVLKQKAAKLEKEAQYYPNGFGTPARKPGTDDEHAKIIENRLYGIIYGTALQMVSEGLCKPEDIDNISRLGFTWELAPFAEMAKNPAKVKEALGEMKKRYGDDFVIPEIPAEKISYTKTEFNPKTGALTLRLDRVQPLGSKHNFNTLGTQTLQAIKQTVEDANNNPDVKTIVFEGNGGRIFSAGANLAELAGTTDKTVINRYIQLGREVMDTVANSKKPTVAKVQGDAYGGGVELALACDRIIASEDAKFTLPEVDLGIYPAWGGTERLPQKVGKPFAKALILAGKSKTGVIKGFPPVIQNIVNGQLKWGIDLDGGFQLDAKTAQRLGLVHVVVPRVSIDDATEKLLADPAFAVKPGSGDESVNPNRGLKNFPTVASYPKDIQEKFQLADIEKYSSKLTGRFTKDSWNLAKRLIEVCDTPQAGKASDAEVSKLLDNAAERNTRIMDMAEAGILEMDGKIKENRIALLNIIKRDSSTLMQPVLWAAEQALIRNPGLSAPLIWVLERLIK